VLDEQAGVAYIAEDSPENAAGEQSADVAATIAPQRRACRERGAVATETRRS